MLAAAIVFGALTALKVVDNGERIVRAETRLDHVETQIGNIEAQLKILIERSGKGN